MKSLFFDFDLKLLDGDDKALAVEEEGVELARVETTLVEVVEVIRATLLTSVVTTLTKEPIVIA